MRGDSPRRVDVFPVVRRARARRRAVAADGRVATHRANDREAHLPGAEEQRQGGGGSRRRPRGARPGGRGGGRGGGGGGASSSSSSPLDQLLAKYYRCVKYRVRRAARQRPRASRVRVARRGSARGVPREGFRGDRLLRRERARGDRRGHPVSERQGRAGGAEAAIQRRRRADPGAAHGGPVVLAAGVPGAQPGGRAVPAAQERPRRDHPRGRTVRRDERGPGRRPRGGGARATPPEMAQAEPARVRVVRRVRRGPPRLLPSQERGTPAGKTTRGDPRERTQKRTRGGERGGGEETRARAAQSARRDRTGHQTLLRAEDAGRSRPRLVPAAANASVARFAVAARGGTRRRAATGSAAGSAASCEPRRDAAGVGTRRRSRRRRTRPDSKRRTRGGRRAADVRVDFGADPSAARPAAGPKRRTRGGHAGDVRAEHAERPADPGGGRAEADAARRERDRRTVRTVRTVRTFRSFRTFRSRSDLSATRGPPSPPPPPRGAPPRRDREGPAAGRGGARRSSFEGSPRQRRARTRGRAGSSSRTERRSLSPTSSPSRAKKRAGRRTSSSRTSRGSTTRSRGGRSPAPTRRRIPPRRRRRRFRPKTRSAPKRPGARDPMRASYPYPFPRRIALRMIRRSLPRPPRASVLGASRAGEGSSPARTTATRRSRGSGAAPSGTTCPTSRR